MHELGTIDMFDHAGTERLGEARRAAGEFGALSTAAVVDLQLAAVGHSRFELDIAAAHARSALALSERLALGQVRAKALAMLAENAAWRGDREEMERFIGLATSAAPQNLMLTAFAWGARGMRELLHGDRSVAVEHLGRATVKLADLPHAEPACFRAVWPVLLASMGDRRAAEAVGEARRLGVGAFHLNSGLLTYAEAIIMGRTGDRATARRLAGSSEADFVNCTAWTDVARWLAAESAVSGGWDQPGWWLLGVGDRLAGYGLDSLANRCRDLAGGPQRWAGLGITAREADVLSLVVEGLANKEIAARLFLSPRTVEKHVEALLRKLDARSRTQLVGVAEARVQRTPT
jgi:DNA-binding CsgD family transcriptional regulator